MFAGSDPCVSALTARDSSRSSQYSRYSSKQQVSDSISVGVLGEPYFVDEDVSIKNVSAQLGVTTYLHCRVNNLGGKTVRPFPSFLSYVFFQELNFHEMYANILFILA